jgi:hypothetical protein
MAYALFPHRIRLSFSCSLGLDLPFVPQATCSFSPLGRRALAWRWGRINTFAPSSFAGSTNGIDAIIYALYFTPATPAACDAGSHLCWLLPLSLIMCAAPTVLIRNPGATRSSINDMVFGTWPFPYGRSRSQEQFGIGFWKCFGMRSLWGGG